MIGYLISRMCACLRALRRRQRGLRIMLIASCMSWTIVISACTPSHAPPQPLADIHLPGVTKLAQLSPFLARFKGNGTGFAPYASLQPPAGTHLLMVFREQLYDITLSNAAVTSIDLQPACIGDVSVSADNHWGACVTYQGIETFALNAASSPPGASPSVHALVIPRGYPSGAASPSWSPDGKDIAVTEGAGGASSITIYAIAANHQSAALLATLSLANASLGDVTWSSDGKWLAFAAEFSPTASAYYALSLDRLMPNPLVRHDAQTRITVSPGDLVDLGRQASSIFTWRPNSTTLTMVSNDRRSIANHDVRTGRSTPLLTQGVGAVCAVAWLPDRSALLFQVCGPSSTDTYPPPSQVYEFTPPQG